MKLSSVNTYGVTCFVNFALYIVPTNFSTVHLVRYTIRVLRNSVLLAIRGVDSGKSRRKQDYRITDLQHHSGVIIFGMFVARFYAARVHVTARARLLRVVASLHNGALHYLRIALFIAFA